MTVPGRKAGIFLSGLNGETEHAEAVHGLEIERLKGFPVLGR